MIVCRECSYLVNRRVVECYAASVTVSTGDDEEPLLEAGKVAIDLCLVTRLEVKSLSRGGFDDPLFLGSRGYHDHLSAFVSKRWGSYTSFNAAIMRSSARCA